METFFFNGFFVRRRRVPVLFLTGLIRLDSIDCLFDCLIVKKRDKEAQACDLGFFSLGGFRGCFDRFLFLAGFMLSLLA